MFCDDSSSRTLDSKYWVIYKSCGFFSCVMILVALPFYLSAPIRPSKSELVIIFPPSPNMNIMNIVDTHVVAIHRPLWA